MIMGKKKTTKKTPNWYVAINYSAAIDRIKELKKEQVKWRKKIRLFQNRIKLETKLYESKIDVLLDIIKMFQTAIADNEIKIKQITKTKKKNV